MSKKHIGKVYEKHFGLDKPLLNFSYTWFWLLLQFEGIIIEGINNYLFVYLFGNPFP